MYCKINHFRLSALTSHCLDCKYCKYCKCYNATRSQLQKRNTYALMQLCNFHATSVARRKQRCISSSLDSKLEQLATSLHFANFTNFTPAELSCNGYFR